MAFENSKKLLIFESKTEEEMNTATKKLKLVEWVSSLEDESIIEKLFFLKEHEKNNKGDWWNIISETEKQSVERGLKDLRNGKLKAHSTVKRGYEKWL